MIWVSCDTVPQGQIAKAALRPSVAGLIRIRAPGRGVGILDGMSDPDLYPCFLGPYGENDQLLEKLVVEFLRDHVYWRRNFHPEDPPAIPTHAAQLPAYRDFEARLRRELHKLSAALKRSVPFHSPRYLGHMVSDLLLPGLAAQILTLPYNPNNVSIEAAPITLDMEVQVGLQLARMLGYPHDPEAADCAFGHLTSGGTTANFQGLRLMLALKAFPVALKAAGLPVPGLPEDLEAAWQLTPAAATALVAAWQAALGALSPAEQRRWQQALTAERLETLGLAAFLSRHPRLAPPVVYAPVTAHYSWSKGMKLLGLGSQSLQLIPERGMRTDAEALDRALSARRTAGGAVLCCVGVLGSTEFGTVDPIDRLVELRDRHAAAGLGFGVHVDAAWGGYLCTLFREPDGRLRPLGAFRDEYARFPSEGVYRAFAALRETDSVTIDPHKLGYIAYGAGAFVCRDHRAVTLLDESADYVFTTGPGQGYADRFRALGRYVLEGSKAGAMAAAVYVTHQVLPLDHRHFGRLQRQTLLNTEAFLQAIHDFAERVAPVARVVVPYPPDTNLICVAINPTGNRDVAAMNRCVRGLYDRLRSDRDAPLQLREYFASVTTLQPAMLGEHDTARVLAELGLDLATLDPDRDAAGRLLILRHTLMNPWLIDRENGISYLRGYFEHLARMLTSGSALG